MSPQALWFRFTTEAYLHGPIKSILKAAERSVWIDFHCLAAQGDGDIVIMDRNIVAKQLAVSRKILDSTISKLLKNGFIEAFPNDKTLNNGERFVIKSWLTDQAKYLHKKEKQGINDANPSIRLEERIEEERTEEESREEDNTEDDSSIGEYGPF
jgi:hypothetical protein